MPIRDRKIAFIGGGNMARSLIGGLVAAGVNPDQIWVADPDSAQLEMLRGQHPVHATHDNDEAVLAADVVVLAVKPQMLADAAHTLAPVMASSPLVVSILAGKTVGDLSGALGAAPIVRSMPNTPSAVGRGITAGFAGPGVSPAQVALTTSLLQAVGEVVWLDDEELMDAVTAVSGSGPAYVFWLTECMAAAGEKLGLPAELAASLARATVSGAGELMHQASETPATLRQNVTSPGGTTAAALEVLMAEDGLAPLMVAALTAARDRAREL